MRKYQPKPLAALLAVGCLALGCVSAASYALLPQAAEANYLWPISERDARRGEDLIKEYSWKCRLVQQEDGSPLKRMQDRFVEYNSKRLHYNDGKHSRWIEPVYLTKANIGFAGVTKGNCIILYAGDFEYALQDKQANFIDNSHDAVTMAHELAHFLNKDSYNNRPNSKQEYRADYDAMELLANVPEYSFASLALRQQVEDPDDPHPTNAQRRQMVLEKIAKDSKGRVRIDEEGRMYYRGELFGNEGYLDDGPSYAGKKAKTLFLAAQIATAIKNGWWKRDLIAHGPASNVFEDGRHDRTVLALYTDKTYTTPRKILASFQFDDRLNYSQYTPREQQDVQLLNAIMDLAGK